MPKTKGRHGQPGLYSLADLPQRPSRARSMGDEAPQHRTAATAERGGTGEGAAMKADARSVARSEKEALAWAIDFFSNCAADLTPTGSKRRSEEQRIKEHLGDYDVFLKFNNPEKVNRSLSNLVELARGGNKQQGYYLCELAAALIGRGDPLPTPLREFIAEFLRKKKGRKKRNADGTRDLEWRSGLDWRNERIAVAVLSIMAKWGFPQIRHRRNRDSRRASAASIVWQTLKKSAAKLHISEDAINKICEERAPPRRQILCGIPLKSVGSRRGRFVREDTNK